MITVSSCFFQNSNGPFKRKPLCDQIREGEILLEDETGRDNYLQELLIKEPRAAHGAGPVRGPHLLRPPARLLIPDAVPPPRAGRRPWRRSAPVAAARDASRSRAPSGGGAPARPPRVSGGQCAGPAAAALPPRVRSAPRAGAHAEGGPGLRALPTRAAPRPRAQRSVTVFGNYCRDSYQSPVEPPSSGACPISYMTFLCLTLAF